MIETSKHEELKVLVQNAREGADLIEKGLGLIYGNDVPEGDEAMVENIAPIGRRAIRGRNPINGGSMRDYVMGAIPVGSRLTIADIAERLERAGWSHHCVNRGIYYNTVRVTISKCGLFQKEKEGANVFWKRLR